ncbi:MAG: hypothetical protein GTO45_36390 [Candidatus Aminicenantes bacterium]|nr:hypothetical protein [Candidatus Aminicenantes bacterium]NIM84182.1 hypothetical protein [Candidatus Aminicenantes bacterium]NIN23629.1 hypothetical protein [Candidatus Aminicenantes bacterium]NIN47336.1 hypothetical protein [Candidatus Aminicenantes bacterium]NIN90265.1 hypothetical protein [Candidatus Aminicenantes bacterium]
MRNLTLAKILVVVVIILTANISYSYSQSKTDANVQYVEITLKNGTVEKFDYTAFTLSWIYPITLIRPLTCDEVEINKHEIEEIYVVGEFSNNCVNQGKDDWEFTVYLTDERQLLGFFRVSEFTAKGVLYDSGEEKSIHFKDIKKIVFRR